MKKRLFPAGGLDRIARLLVRGGFFFLFLIPLLPPIYKRLTYQPAAETASWLLPWDPLLALGNLLHGNLSVVVIGAPLLLLALSLVFGRAFCGWVCPVGTLADLVRLLPVRRGKRMPKPGAGGRRNSRLRYVILGAALAGSLLSIKFLGWIDPLVIFSRAANAVGDTLLGSPQDFERGASAYFSLLLLSILLLEFWRARFWCRHLCPLGALFSLVSRWSLLNRRVSAACGNCVRCKRICPMNAIPEDAHNTDYSDCTFCLECESACPENAVSFGFGGLALGVWRPKKGEASSPKAGRRAGEYVASSSILPREKLTRRHLLQGMAGAAAGLAVAPILRLEQVSTPLRPPGALPEEEFIKTCIACQECIRVCPTDGLRAAFLQNGLSRMGMPVLIPRLGGCSLGISCDHLCRQVCPAGAILPLPGNKFKIGTAQVDHTLCLTWDQGVKCLVCVEACHYQAASIFQGRVVVREENCVGCGFCESGCPVPGAAIHVKPSGTSTV